MLVSVLEEPPKQISFKSGCFLFLFCDLSNNKPPLHEALICHTDNGSPFSGFHSKHLSKLIHVNCCPTCKRSLNFVDVPTRSDKQLSILACSPEPNPWLNNLEQSFCQKQDIQFFKKWCKLLIKWTEVRQNLGNELTSRFLFKVVIFSLHTSALFRVTWGVKTKHVTDGEYR